MKARAFVAGAACLVAGALSAPSAYAHTEDNVLAEHPPRTTFGASARGTVLAINDRRLALTFSPFVEYSPLPFVSLGVAVPWGAFDGRVLFSDLQLAVKSLLPIEAVKVVPLVGVEAPTGSAGATSDHWELAPGVFVERLSHPWHLFGYAGGRTSLGAEHAVEDINALAPHARREIATMIGAAYMFMLPAASGMRMLGIDGRIQVFWEDFDEVVPSPQLGLVYQVNRPGGTTIKVSLGGFYTPNGIRRGGGMGLSFYFGL